MANESIFLVRAPRRGRAVLSVPITGHFGVQYAIERAAAFCRDFPEVTLFQENQFGSMQVVSEWVSHEEKRKETEQKKNKNKNFFRHN